MPIKTLIKRISNVSSLIGQEGKGLLNNFLWLSAVQTITYLLPVIMIPYLFKVIGPEKFGLIAFAQAFMQYFMLITDYGFSVSATREISLCRHDPNEVSKVFSEVMVVKLSLAFLSLIILAGTLFFVPRFKADWQVYILSFGSVIGSTLFPVWFFQGIEKMKPLAYLNFFGGIFILFSIFILVQKAEDYLWVPAITSIVLIITGVWALSIAFSKFGVCFKIPKYVNFRNQVVVGWDIFLSNVAINAYTATRTFVVGIVTDKTTTGFYAIAERISGIIQAFPLVALSQAFFPRMNQIYRKSKLSALNIMKQVQSITAGISFFYLAVMFIAAPFIVRLFCGRDFYIAAVSLRLLLAAVFFVNSNTFRVQFLLVCGKTNVYSKIHVANSMVGLPLIFFLVATLGFAGASLAAIAVEAGILFTTYLSLKRLQASWPRFRGRKS